MKKLLELIGNEFCDSDGWFRIVSADWTADELRLDVSVCLCEEKEIQLWEISCESVFEEKLSSDYSEILTLGSDHSLLLKFKEPEVDVAFSRNSMSPDELFGIVATCCFKYLGEQPLTNWINQQASSQGICSSKYGILGRFPVTVANEIVRQLEAKEMSVNLLEPRSPKYWDGAQHCEYPENIEVLIIGDSYVVGTNFSAMRA